MALSTQRASRLRPLLAPFADPGLWAPRIAFDPLEFPRRFEDPRDVEVAGLLASSLAYGRADVFRLKVAGVLEALGPGPARAVQALTVRRAAKLFDGWVYRFNLGADLAVLLLGMGELLRRHGSLDAAFASGVGQPFELRPALAAFSTAVRAAAPARQIVRAMGEPRAVHHLLPSAGGANKRLLLYLRWMVRGPDAVDLGVWKSVSPAQLVVPLDTHVARVSRWLGLTRRTDLSWATAVDVTRSLRLLDPEDPIRFDFALCHFGMSGACPARPRKDNCARCPLAAECLVGRRRPRA
jgi:uncharacterized protein (TIGR02757 family)